METTGTITIVSQKTSTTANYENQEKALAISLNYSIDASAGILDSISGQVTSLDETRRYMGNYSASLVDGSLRYNFSGIQQLVRLADIAECAQDIETQIKPAQADE